MKKLCILLLSLALAVSFGIGHATAADPQYTMKMVTYHAPNLAFTFRNMAKNIETMSGGRIKVNLFVGGELVSSSDALKAVRAGTIQIAHGSAYHWDEMKSAGVETGLPMTWVSAVESEVLWENMGFKDLVAKTYDAAGVHYLGEVWIAPYAITTKKPITGIADLQKIKIRATTGPAKMFNKLNIRTVYLKPEEMYMALSTGQIDGVLYGGAAEYKELNFPEVCPYYCSTYITNPISDCFIINKKLWEELPADLKAILEHAAYRGRWEYYSWLMGEEYKILETAYKGKVTTLDPQSVAKMTEAAQVIWEEEAKASPLAGQMVEKMKGLLRSAGRLK